MLTSTIPRLLFKPNLLISRCKTCSALSESTISPQVTQECYKKLLKVAIIGMPNAGKSTFINGLMDRKVFATSQKVHTTRTKAKAIFTENDTQIIFMDSPGLVNEREQKRFNLTSKFTRDSKNVANDSNIIGVVHDVSNVWTRERLDIKIINILDNHKEKPSFLVLNKVDILKSKRKLLDIVRILTGNSINGKPLGPAKPLKLDNENDRCWPYFSNIFMTSALTGDGMDDIKKYLLNKAKPGKWMFPNHIWTDQNAEMVIVNTVKGALLDSMPQEVPYNIQPCIEYFNIDESGKITTVVIVNCPTARISRLLVGASEGRLRNITECVQKNLQDCFHNFVKIRIVPNPSPLEDTQ